MFKVIKEWEGKTPSVCAEFEDLVRVRRLANQNINISLRKLKKEVEISIIKEEKEMP